MKKVLLIKPPFQFIPIEHYTRRLAAGEYLAVGTGGFVYGINWFREMLVRLKSLSPSKLT